MDKNSEQKCGQYQIEDEEIWETGSNLSIIKLEQAPTAKLSESSSIGTDLQTDTKKTMFQSTVGAIISCLGSAIGTGNIWRFPRILATHSYAKGSLTFYIVWIIILFTWSIPIIVVEYAIGRFTQLSTPLAYSKFMGPKYFWIGAWMLIVLFLLSSYYSVIVGWCFYYLYMACSLPSLPTTEHEGKALFSDYADKSAWPVLTQLLAALISGICLAGGIKWIEKANIILVPLLLVIVIFTFGWSITRQYAEVGISFLFTPTWSSLAYPSLWIGAVSQNAFDTSAGMSILATYGTFMTQSSAIVSYSFLIPMANNIVSFYASIMVFCTVFSTIIQTNPTATRAYIVKIMQDAGPGSTGLTFTWIPVLFSKVGYFGRVLCVLFFLCLVFAGVSSLVANIQVPIVVFRQLGVRHRYAVIAAVIANVLVGLPSALKLNILANQDDTWANGLIVSGLLFSILVLFYGPLRFRRVVINKFGENDWKLTILWVPLIMFAVPLQAGVLLVWWVYDYIRLESTWYIPTWSSITTILIEWLAALILILLANLILYRMNIIQDALDTKCIPDTFEIMSRDESCSSSSSESQCEDNCSEHSFHITPL